ncbi:MAG: endonuclease MutS2 [Candidatus Faecalibacterium intestinavium]|uniref:Endonuclease MutS2 n=1 Tax=Candidatus Faecalibacterium intestinavium TaxID=2838580 RepID=A0A9E2KJ98_9FIRM|nr:endonuclease MutS2 [Candidatus Faecalibacterium intestinavium]
MEISYLHTLELDKIIHRAAEGCVCKEAKAKLLEIEPQCDTDEVRYALEQTDAINTLLIKNGSPRFGGVEGVSQLATRAVKGGVLSMGELLLVAGALRNFQNLTAWYGSTDHEALPTDDLFYALAPQPGLEKEISSCILAPDTMADTASHTLNDLRRKIRATENSIRDRLESLIHNLDTSKYLQESVVSIRNGRYVVPVKSEYRGEFSGIIHDVSSTGATVFVEPQAVVEANAKILQYRAQEAQEIERILTALTAQVAAIEPQFQFSYQAMLEIDILLAKARMALEMKAFKPAVRYETSFSLIRARHPLIDPAKCVPVDIALGETYDSLMITGPNTGGKTVTLKTAGLLCAMAQCGFLIPADERSEICVFQEFLVDIGDEQSIEQSLSTFSGHIKKITGILELARPDTLVLLDELGAGTDPAEGAALAVSIIEALRRRGVLLMATTHYAELKVFALETPGVVNASCEFDLETLRPTYKLSVGVPGKSNAFLISEKLGIPSEIIDAARQHLSADDKRLDAVLGQLDDLKLQLKASQDELEGMRSEAASQLAAAQKKRDELIQQGENELEAARAKARQLAQQVESQAFALTDELRRLQKEEKMSAQQRALRAREIAKKETERLFANTDVVHNPVKEFVPLKSVQVGQEVCIAELNQIATVLALPDKNGDVLVRAGIIKTKVPLSGLKQPDKMVKNETKPITKAQQRYSRQTGKGGPTEGRVERVQRTAKMECNLLGLTVDEAIYEADAFIDRAILNGQSTVYLIHGNGTGALRNAIQKHLRGHRMVKSFRLGRYGEGESGVTVVELK